jgi:hypothetical protein
MTDCNPVTLTMQFHMELHYSKFKDRKLHITCSCYLSRSTALYHHLIIRGVLSKSWFAMTEIF